MIIYGGSYKKYTSGVNLDVFEGVQLIYGHKKQLPNDAILPN